MPRLLHLALAAATTLFANTAMADEAQFRLLAQHSYASVSGEGGLRLAADLQRIYTGHEHEPWGDDIVLTLRVEAGDGSCPRAMSDPACSALRSVLDGRPSRTFRAAESVETAVSGEENRKLLARLTVPRGTGSEDMLLMVDPGQPASITLISQQRGPLAILPAIQTEHPCRWTICPVAMVALDERPKSDRLDLTGFNLLTPWSDVARMFDAAYSGEMTARSETFRKRYVRQTEEATTTGPMTDVSITGFDGTLVASFALDGTELSVKLEGYRAGDEKAFARNDYAARGQTILLGRIVPQGDGMAITGHLFLPPDLAKTMTCGVQRNGSLSVNGTMAGDTMTLAAMTPACPTLDGKTVAAMTRVDTASALQRDGVRRGGQSTGGNGAFGNPRSPSVNDYLGHIYSAYSDFRTVTVAAEGITLHAGPDSRTPVIKRLAKYNNDTDVVADGCTIHPVGDWTPSVIGESTNINLAPDDELPAGAVWCMVRIGPHRGWVDMALMDENTG